MVMCDREGAVLIAPNLGSCIGLAVFEPRLRIGAMIHCLLPLSKSDPEKAANNPFLYVDTGLSTLFSKFFERGADKRGLVIIGVGGANINDDNNVFEVGKKNITVLRKFLWKNNLLLSAEDLGESFSRTLSLDTSTGKVSLKVNGSTRELN
jgi:chemotaxis protein CheD